jgi:hypothetical protein
MAAVGGHDDDAVPPPSEQVHLPGPSYLPALTALGVTLGLVGVVINYMIAAIGVAIAVIAIGLWIRDVRSDIAELPLEH